MVKRVYTVGSNINQEGYKPPRVEIFPEGNKDNVTLTGISRNN